MRRLPLFFGEKFSRAQVFKVPYSFLSFLSLRPAKSAGHRLAPYCSGRVGSASLTAAYRILQTLERWTWLRASLAFSMETVSTRGLLEKRVREGFRNFGASGRLSVGDVQELDIQLSVVRVSLYLHMCSKRLLSCFLRFVGGRF